MNFIAKDYIFDIEEDKLGNFLENFNFFCSVLHGDEFVGNSFFFRFILSLELYFFNLRHSLDVLKKNNFSFFNKFVNIFNSSCDSLFLLNKKLLKLFLFKSLLCRLFLFSTCEMKLDSVNNFIRLENVTRIIVNIQVERLLIKVFSTIPVPLKISNFGNEVLVKDFLSFYFLLGSFKNKNILDLFLNLNKHVDKGFLFFYEKLKFLKKFGMSFLCSFSDLPFFFDFPSLKSFFLNIENFSNLFKHSSSEFIFYFLKFKEFFFLQKRVFFMSDDKKFEIKRLQFEINKMLQPKNLRSYLLDIVLENEKIISKHNLSVSSDTFDDVIFSRFSKKSLNLDLLTESNFNYFIYSCQSFNFSTFILQNVEFFFSVCELKTLFLSFLVNK